jgi:hypothetical protein
LLLSELALNGHAGPSNPTLIAFKIIALLAIFTVFILMLDYFTMQEAQEEEASVDPGLADTEVQAFDPLIECYHKCTNCEHFANCIPGSQGSPTCDTADLIVKLEKERRRVKEK